MPKPHVAHDFTKESELTTKNTQAPTPELIAIIHTPTLAQLPSKKRDMLFCKAALAYNKKRIHNALVLHKETEQELEFIFYPNAANQLKPSAPPAFPKALIKAITPSSLNLAALKSTSLPNAHSEPKASFKFHKNTSLLTINMFDFDELQAQETIKTGLELVTKTCIKNISPKEKIEISLDIPSHFAEVGAKAFIKFLETKHSQRVNHLNLHHNRDRTEAFLTQLARLSANDLKLRVRIQTLLCAIDGTPSPEAEFFNAELENYTVPSHQPHSLLDFVDGKQLTPSAPPLPIETMHSTFTSLDPEPFANAEIEPDENPQ